MDSSFLLEANWPAFGQGTVSGHSKTLHDWYGRISKFVLMVSARVKQMHQKFEMYVFKCHFFRQ